MPCFSRRVYYSGQYLTLCDIPGSNPDTRNLMPYVITLIDLDFLLMCLHEEALSYEVATVIQGKRK